MITREQLKEKVDVKCPQCGETRKLVMDSIRRWQGKHTDKKMEDYAENNICPSCRIKKKGWKERGLSQKKKYDTTCHKCGKTRTITGITINGWLFLHKDKNVDDYFKESLCESCSHLLFDDGVITYHGYRMVLMKQDDKFYSMAQKHNDGGEGKYCLEHRYVMAQTLGRPLEKWECVHHKDGNKLNNKPDNLELVTRQSHLTCGMSADKEKHYIDLIIKLREENNELKQKLVGEPKNNT